MSSEFAKSTIFCTITPALLLSSFSVFSPCKQMVPDSNRAIKYSSLIYCCGKCLICIQRGGNMIFFVEFELSLLSCMATGLFVFSVVI